MNVHLFVKHTAKQTMVSACKGTCGILVSMLNNLLKSDGTPSADHRVATPLTSKCVQIRASWLTAANISPHSSTYHHHVCWVGHTTLEPFWLCLPGKLHVAAQLIVVQF